jgi:hypothetical protein
MALILVIKRDINSEKWEIAWQKKW